jgi:hypothetical protein
MRKLLRRWYWWLPAVILAAAVGYVGHRAVHQPWTDTAAWQKYRQIRLGMTFREMATLVGDRPCVTGYNGYSLAVWLIGDDEVWVYVDRQGRVYGKSAVIQDRDFVSSIYDKPWWDRWRARLGW